MLKGQATDQRKTKQGAFSSGNNNDRQDPLSTTNRTKHETKPRSEQQLGHTKNINTRITALGHQYQRITALGHQYQNHCL